MGWATPDLARKTGGGRMSRRADQGYTWRDCDGVCAGAGAGAGAGFGGDGC